MINRILSPVVHPSELTEFFVANTRLAATQEWLMQVLNPHCRNEARGWNGGTLRAMQEPYELASFLIFLKKREVKTYIEMGTCFGGTLYIVDSYLRANVPGFEFSVGVDAGREPDWWTSYKSAWPKTQFHKCRTSEFQWPVKFDAALLDAGHHHRHVMIDFGLASPHCRFVGIHDIASKRNAGAPAAWNELKEQFAIYTEFIFWLRRRRWMKGIGVIDTWSRRKPVMKSRPKGKAVS